MSVTLGQAVVYLAAENARLKRDLDNAEHMTRSWTGKVSGFMSNALSYATGTLITQGIIRITESIVGLGQEALRAVASHERLGLSLETLVARELKNASGTEKWVSAGHERIMLTEKEQAALEKLTGTLQAEAFKRDQLAEKIEIERERLVRLEGAKKRDEVAIRSKQLALEKMEYQYGQLNESIADHQSQVDALRARDGQLVEVTEKVIEGQLTMNEALKQAGPKAKALLDWIQKLAIKSPFTQEGVAEAFKTAMAYGFTADEAQRLTTAMIDFAAGAGASESVMNQVALALGQIKAKGKLAGQEVLQLVNAGVDVRGILAKAFGVTTAELEDMQEKGLIPADKAIAAIVESLEEDFGGAAERQSSTLSGLIASLSDLREVSLRNLFEAPFQAVQPYLASVVDKISDPAFQDGLRAFGDFLGSKLAGGLEKLSALGNILQGLWDGDPFAVEVARQELGRVGDILAATVEGWKDGGLKGAFSALGSVAWEWLTGPGGVIEQAGPRLELYGYALQSAIIRQWPKVTAQLDEWRTAFWDWLTGEDGALVHVAEKMDGLSREIESWVYSKGTQEALKTLGRSTGKFIGDGIVQLFSGDGEGSGDSIILSVASSLLQSAMRNTTSFNDIGATIEAYVIAGFIEAITGQEVKDDVAQKIKDVLKEIVTLTNPLSLGIEMANSMWTGFKNTWDNFIAMLKGEEMPHSIQSMMPKIPGMDSGGIVPGPLGSPQLILAHGGETVLPTHKLGGGLNGRQEHHVYLHNVPSGVNQEAIEEAVYRAIKEAYAELQSRVVR